MAAAVLSDQEHILEMILRECAKYDRGADGYAAWLAAQNRVADGIACFEKHAPDAHAPLVYLYRAIGRTDEALKLAKDESEQLHAGLALELGDWSQASKKGRPHTQELVSYLQSGEWPDTAPDLWQLVATGQFDEALEGYLATHQYHDAYALLLHQGRVVEALDLSEGEWTGHEYNRLLLLSRHGRSEGSKGAIWDKWAQNLTRADINQQLAVIDAAASMEMDDTLKQLLNSNLVILQKPEALWSSLDDDWEHTIAAARCSRPHSTRPHRMPACTRSTRSPLTQANRNESSISKSPICCHSRTAMSAWPSASPCTRSTCHGWLRSKWNSRAPPPSLALGSTRVCCPTRPHRVPVRRLSARLPGTSRPYLLISPSRNEHHTVYAQLLGEMHRFQAAAELAAGDPAKAESEYRKMMALNPSVDLVIEAVTRLEAAGATKAADSLYKARHSLLQEQLDALPDSAFARNDAAWFMANCNRNVEEAVATATRAVELAPNNAAIRDTLAEGLPPGGKT